MSLRNEEMIHALEAHLTKVKVLYSTRKSMDEWLADADQSIGEFQKFLALTSNQSSHRGLEAAQEWRKLIEEDRTTEDDCDRLFDHAKSNMDRGMAWRQLADDIARWMYSHGHARALTLSHNVNQIRAMQLQLGGDA
jgi:hypothetical protein